MLSDFNVCLRLFKDQKWDECINYIDLHWSKDKLSINLENIKALCFKNKGNFKASSKSFNDAIIRFPDSTGLRKNYLNLLLECKQYQAADDVCNECIKVFSVNSSFWLYKLKIYFHTSEFADISEIASVIEISVLSDVECIDYCILLYEFQYLQPIEKVLLERPALETDPKILNLLSLIDRANGKKAEAVRKLSSCMEVDPNFMDAYYNMGLIEPSFLQPFATQLKENLRYLDNTQRMKTLFTLAYISETLSEYDEALDLYGRANQCGKLAYDLQLTDFFRFIKKIKSIDNYLVDNKLPNIITDDPVMIPVFLVGLPRSGTTILEKYLSENFVIKACGELPFATQSINQSGLLNCPTSEIPNALNSIRKEYKHRFKKKYINNVQYYIDKMPLNFLTANILKYALPEAKFIFIHRDHKNNFWSLYRHYFTGSANCFCYDPIAIHRMFHIFEEQLKLFKEAHGIASAVSINYEDFVSNPEEVTYKIVKKFDLKAKPMDTKQKIPIYTASALQVSNPISKNFNSNSYEYQKLINRFYEANFGRNV